MTTIRYTGDALWARMERAVEKVRERLERAARALTEAGVPYALAGGNAVAAWVAQVDESAVRNTRDVDLLLRREDLPRAKAALEAAGFVYRHAKSVDMFLDGPGAKACDAVHIIFAGEKVRDEYSLPAPELSESRPIDEHQVLELDALVRMKLTSYRRKDQVHILDMLSIGLIDESWLERLPAELTPRLKALIDDPDG